MPKNNSTSFILALIIILIITQIALSVYTDSSLIDRVVDAVQYEHVVSMSFRAALLGQ